MAAAGGYSRLAVSTWPRPRAAMRGVLMLHPGEPAILAFGVLAMLFVFIGRLPATLAMALPEAATREALVAAQFVTLVLFAPLFVYGFAALMRLGFRLAGGRGNWHTTRLATFWALLVTAPAHGLAAMSSHPAPGLAAAAAGWWVLSGCLAEAEEVAQWRAALVSGAVAGALLGLGWLMAVQA